MGNEVGVLKSKGRGGNGDGTLKQIWWRYYGEKHRGREWGGCRDDKEFSNRKNLKKKRAAKKRGKKDRVSSLREKGG